MVAISLFGGFDIGTRNSAACCIDGKGKLKNLSFQGGGVHTSNLPFVRTAVQMLDATVKQLHDAGLTYCSLANAKQKGMNRAQWYGFLDGIVKGCVFELPYDTTEHLVVDGWKYDLAGSSLDLISDHAFRAKRHVQDGKTTFELKGRAGETIWVYPCFLHTLFARYVLTKMVTTAGLPKDAKIQSLTSYFHTLSVTVPNAYNEHTKEEIKDIFDAAGLPKAKVTIVNESVAGMLGYIHLNLEEMRGLIEEAKRPIIVCNLDCGSQTNDASLFEVRLDKRTGQFEVKVLAYQANRASGEALTEALMQEVTKAFKAARPGEFELPDFFGLYARRAVEAFKVGVMGAPTINHNPDSKQQQVMTQSVERVSIGEVNGVDIQVSTTAIWDIYQRIAQEIADPVHKMLQWFEPTKAPRIDALIYTGGGTKSAVTRMLVEGLLHADGSGPLVNAEALSNDKLDLDLMVARGAAIFAAGKAKVAEFKHDGDEYAVLNVSACDVLPGRVLLADREETGALRYDKILSQFAPVGTKHSWLNTAQDDPTMVFCLKMDTGYARHEDIFNAPFGVRLPTSILGKPFIGEFEYKGDGKIVFQIYPQCSHKQCKDKREPRATMFKLDGKFYCGTHKPVDARPVKLAQEFAPATLSFEAFARRPGKQGVVDLASKFTADYLMPYLRRLNGAEEETYRKALLALNKQVQSDLGNPNASVGSIGDSVLYHLLNFAANFEVDIVTKDMKQQLALANVDARTTRQSAAPGAASAASSSGKKRARKETPKAAAAAAGAAASAKAGAAAAAAEEEENGESPLKGPKTPRLTDEEKADAAAASTLCMLEAFPRNA